jgi:hypothetical protein
MLGEQEKNFNIALRPTFLDSIYTFFELTFHDFSLAQHQNIYISAK